jgi:hypothetical protein
MVVAYVLSHQSLQMSVVEDDHVIQQVSAAASHPTLRDAVGMSVQLHRMAMLKFDVSE